MPLQISAPDQLNALVKLIHQYLRLPLSDNCVPGSFLEGVLAHVRNGTRLNTYDFVDVIRPKDKIGWQVKSTKSTTPVTWKRAKIPDAIRLILASESDDAERGLQALGDAIIGFCNNHALESMKKYDLNELYYSRLILFRGGRLKYLERKLCDLDNCNLFEPEDDFWRWSKQKNGPGKEQLTALHGIDRKSGKKAWSWHGRGENQLHFTGESLWWDDPSSTCIEFEAPSDANKIQLEKLMVVLEAIDAIPTNPEQSVDI